MESLFARLSPRLHPRAAVVVFIAAVASACIKLLAGPFRIELRVVAWIDVATVLLVGTAALMNARTSRFRAAQRYWAGRAPILAVLGYSASVALLLAAGVCSTLSLSASAPGWLGSCRTGDLLSHGLWVLRWGALLHGIGLHIFTPTRYKLGALPVSAPPVLRTMAWLGILMPLLGNALAKTLDEGAPFRYAVGALGALLFAIAYTADGIIINRLPRPTAQPYAEATLPSVSRHGRLTRRGWAGAVFWLALFLYSMTWFIVHFAPLPYQLVAQASRLLWTGLLVPALAGFVVVATPHPAVLGREAARSPRSMES